MLILPKFIYRVNAIPKIQNLSKVDFNCSPPGSSVRGLLQARILEWVARRSPGDLPYPEIKPGSPTMQADSLPSEPPGKPP